MKRIEDALVKQQQQRQAQAAQEYSRLHQMRQNDYKSANKNSNEPMDDDDDGDDAGDMANDYTYSNQ